MMRIVVIVLAGAVVCALCVAEHLVDVKNELGHFVKWKTLGLNHRLCPASLEVIEED